MSPEPAAADTYLTLDLALRIGELLLSNGAGAADVSAQMSNVAKACGLHRVVADVTFTGISLSYQARLDEPALIQVRQVRQREIDYGDLSEVDRVVRDLIQRRIDRDGARACVAKITSTGHSRRRSAVTLGWALMGAGVGLILGGRPLLVLIAFIAAGGIDVLQRRLSTSRLPSFYVQVAGGLFATLVAVATAALHLDVNPSRVITASIIMLLAGISFMGALQDALTGYPITASARILEAVLATAGVIAGVTGGFVVAQAAGVSLGQLHPGSSALSGPLLLTLGGAVAAAAFGYASYVPTRAVLPIGIIGGIATGLYGAMYEHGFGNAWASALAATVVGLVSYPAASRVRVPALAIVVPAIVPLLPGLSIYRGLSLMALGSQQTAAGLVSMVNAVAVAVALAAGVILGEYVAQPVGREARRMEQRLAGPRLVGPVSARSLRRRR